MMGHGKRSKLKDQASIEYRLSKMLVPSSQRRNQPRSSGITDPGDSTKISQKGGSSPYEEGCGRACLKAAHLCYVVIERSGGEGAEACA